jgi:hypothetical protein
MTETIQKLRTPYHELGANGTPTVPNWARQRSVYRSAGRTLYLVETDSLDTAKSDLERLARRGWNVHIDGADARTASISLTRAAA